MNTTRDGEEQDLFGHAVDGKGNMESPELPLAPPPRVVKLASAKREAVTPVPLTPAAEPADTPTPKPPVRLQAARKPTPTPAAREAQPEHHPEPPPATPATPVPPPTPHLPAVNANVDAQAGPAQVEQEPPRTIAAAVPTPTPTPTPTTDPAPTRQAEHPPASFRHDPRPLRLTGHGGHPPTRGQLLQEARVRCDLSLDQVAIATKIKRQFLESIERDDAEHLPPEVYVKAYVRRLCHHYGLDEEQVFALAVAQPAKHPEKTIPNEILQHIEEGKQVNPAEEKKIRHLTWAAVAAVILIAGTGVGIYLGQRQPAPQTPGLADPGELAPILVEASPENAAALAAEIARELERRSPPAPPLVMSELPLP
jgi:hypothetical protein